jgi:K+ transporter
MKKYEIDLIIGTFLTFLGVILLYFLKLHFILGWFIIIVGKLIIFISIMEYTDYRRMLKGEDLSKDNSIKKTIRKLRRKRYD